MPVEITTAATEILVNLMIAVMALLGALATFYVQKGIKKLQAETEKVQDEATRDFLFSALARLDDVAFKTVNKIEQTTKEQLLLAIRNGVKNKEDLKLLSLEAYKEIVKTLEPEYLNVINGTMGDAETYIMNLIEEKLELVKQRSPQLALAKVPRLDEIALKDNPVAPEISS